MNARLWKRFGRLVPSKLKDTGETDRHTLSAQLSRVTLPCLRDQKVATLVSIGQTILDNLGQRGVEPGPLERDCQKLRVCRAALSLVAMQNRVFASQLGHQPGACLE